MFFRRKSKQNKKLRARLSPTQIIALTFLAIILAGTLLLMLPAASRNGVSCGFRPALFTATSATCVTGLVLYDTWTQFSGFGQAVILSLIEVGGLGFMTAAALVVFVFRRRVGLRQRMLIAQALSLEEMDSVVKIQKMVLFGSLSVQLCGAIVLTLGFLKYTDLSTAALWGIFHAVSGFCNAGFDILGCISPGKSLMEFNSDPVILVTLMVLVVVGGLGFFVWEEIVRVKKLKKFSVYTKLVLLMTGSLILAGAILTLLLEWDNPDTLGSMSWGDKILNSFFQSVTLRTAGFAAVDQGKLTGASKALSVLFMLIGGSSGSTAGGMKTVTFLVLLLFLWNRARGRKTVNVFRRQIPGEKVLDAMTIVGIMLGLTFFGAVFITATSPVDFLDALFEAGSALATVGLTAGCTTLLSVPAQYLIILFMFFGRVGVLTISLGFLLGDKAEDRFSYARTNLLIG